MGLNFYYNDGLQPKIRAAIINEHECKKGPYYTSGTASHGTALVNSTITMSLTIMYIKSYKIKLRFPHRF